MEDILQSFELDIRIIGDKYKEKIIREETIVKKKKSIITLEIIDSLRMGLERK